MFTTMDFKNELNNFYSNFTQRILWCMVVLRAVLLICILYAILFYTFGKFRVEITYWELWYSIYIFFNVILNKTADEIVHNLFME